MCNHTWTSIHHSLILDCHLVVTRHINIQVSAALTDISYHVIPIILTHHSHLHRKYLRSQRQVCIAAYIIIIRIIFNKEIFNLESDTVLT